MQVVLVLHRQKYSSVGPRNFTFCFRLRCYFEIYRKNFNATGFRNCQWWL